MKRAFSFLAACALVACLPRDNPFDRDDVENAYGVRIAAPEGQLRVQFNPLGGTGLLGYRVYREDASGSRTLVAELSPNATSAVDDGAALAGVDAETQLGDGTLWWRVAGYTEGGVGPMSARTDVASTLALPDTEIEPIADYITGAAGVAVHVSIRPGALPDAPTVRHFRYRFAGGEWTEPILAGPLVLTGLLDGRYTIEVAAVDAAGDVDVTPARATFTYDYHVPEGTACEPAICSRGLACVEEPVGDFCRTLCNPDEVDGGPGCPIGTACLRGVAPDAGVGACVAVAAARESCLDRFCAEGLACQDTADARSLCGSPCGADGGCAQGERCLGEACLPVARVDEGCVQSACDVGLACESGQTPRCRWVCQTTEQCSQADICEEIGRGDLRVCR